MSFSTSSSEPTGTWGRTWLLALVLVFAVLGTLEMYWRSQGFAPAVRDSARLWSAHRQKASGLTMPASVVVGASQSQFGIVPPTMANATGWPAPVVLSMQGRSPLPILADLARDPTFSGLVIVGVNERILFQRYRRRERRANERLEESRALASSIVAPADATLGAQLESVLVIRNPYLSLDRQLRFYQAGFALQPRERWVLPDRSAKMDFRRGDPDRMHQRWLGNLVGERPPRNRVRDEIIEEVRESIEAIQGRGGEVVLVRMPSSRELAALESEKFPRERFWDVLVERAGAPAIHFADYPGLARIPTPDGSHIDAQDAPAFTRELARILRDELAILQNEPRQLQLRDGK